MKRIVVFFIFLLLSFSLSAQTWNEWFQQKKTQINYLTQQIVDLQVYAGYLSKGYKIAKHGLNTIGEIKVGELNLHQAFVSSLSNINPSVQHDFRIVGIVALQVNIVSQYHNCLQKANSSGDIKDDEIKYLHSVFDDLLNNCGKEITELTSLITKGHLQLSDDERLQRIDAIYQNMKDRYQFAQSFSGEVNKLALSRQKAQNEISETKILYNLK